MIYYDSDGELLPVTRDDRDWVLFYIFGLVELDADSVGWDHHLDWVRGRPFDSPDEWLGPEGDHFRAAHGSTNPCPSRDLMRRWKNFKSANAKTPLREIDRMLVMLIEGYE